MSSATTCVMAIAIAPTAVYRVAPRLVVVLVGAIAVRIVFVLEGERAWTCLGSSPTCRKPSARPRECVSFGGVALERVARAFHNSYGVRPPCLKQRNPLNRLALPCFAALIHH